MRFVTVASALCTAFAMTIPARAQDVADMLARAAPAILRVSALNCAGGGDRSGSAFAWQLPGRVVTALHVVAGCSELRVLYQGKPIASAKVRRTLRERDLAELEVTDAPAVTALQAAPGTPATNDIVYLYGFGGGRTTREDRRLRITHASTATPRLADAVDDSARAELTATGSPSLATEVLRIEGFFVPGDSGAPILNAEGQVVGIGSGGLQRGTIGAGWAIRARYLADLGQSTELAAGIATAGNSSFATVDPTRSKVVNCGQITFRRIRTLSLQQLYATSDDQAGWAYLAVATGETLDKFLGLRFDIWTDAETGMAIAVPEQMSVTPGSNGCRAKGSVDEIELLIAGQHYDTRLTDPNLIVARGAGSANAFDALWAPEFAPYLYLQNAFSNPGPRPQGSGAVRRIGWAGVPPGQDGHYIFESLIAGPSSFVGMVAINRAYSPNAPMLPTLKTAWIAATFAVHLSRQP